MLQMHTENMPSRERGFHDMLPSGFVLVRHTQEELVGFSVWQLVPQKSLLAGAHYCL